MTALRRLLNVSLLVSVRAGSPIFDAFARMHAEFLGGWLLVAVLALLRLRNTAALATAVLLIWLAYSSSQAVNWSYIDAPSMLALVAAGLETAALLASPGPARAVQIMNWKHYVLALAIPLGLAATLNWAGLDHPSITSSIMITVCALTLSGMALASPLGKRVAALLALPVYYLIVELLVPPSMTGGPYNATSGWEGPLRITLTILPFAVLLCVTLTAALRAVPHPPRQPGGLGFTARFRAFNSASGEMLKKGQDARNPRMHIITGSGRRGHNPNDHQDSHGPAC